MKILNPFITSGYQGSKYFCDRKNEVAEIINAVENNRNLTLFSHRRMGKSVLLRHVLAKLQRKNYLCIYIDIYSTNSLRQLIQKIAEVISDAKIRNRDNLLLRIVKSLGASLSMDPLSGMPSLDFTYVNNQTIYKSLGEIFRILSEQGKRVVIAIDEFQEVINYEDKLNAEAELRSIVQSFPEIVFLFSGSQKHLMQDIFTNSLRPFYQSTQLMELSEISEDNYLRFIRQVLKDRSVRFENEQLMIRTLEDTHRHTYYSQFLLNRLYGSTNSIISINLYEDVLESILMEQESLAHTYRKLLTSSQWNLLRATAIEEYVAEPYSRAFLNKYDLPAASSVARSVKALLQDDLLIDTGEKGLRVFDVYLMRYLQRLKIT